MAAFRVKLRMMDGQYNFVFIIKGTDIVYPRVMGAPSWIRSEASIIPNEVKEAYVQDVILNSDLKELASWCFLPTMFY